MKTLPVTPPPPSRRGRPLLIVLSAALGLCPASAPCHAQADKQAEQRAQIARGMAEWKKGMAPRVRSLAKPPANAGGGTPAPNPVTPTPPVIPAPPPVTAPPATPPEPTPEVQEPKPKPDPSANGLEIRKGGGDLLPLPGKGSRGGAPDPETRVDPSRGVARGADTPTLRFAPGPTTLPAGDFVPFALAFRPGDSLLTAAYLKRDTLGTAAPQGPLATFAVGVDVVGEVGKVRFEAGGVSEDAHAPAAVEYSPDGSHLIALTDDGKATVWRVEKTGAGNALRYLAPVSVPGPGTDAFARAVAFAPTAAGKPLRCAVAFKSGEVWVYTITPSDDPSKQSEAKRDGGVALTCGGKDLSHVAFITADLLVAAAPNLDNKPGGLLYWTNKPGVGAATAPYPYAKNLFWIGQDSVGLPLLVTGDAASGIQLVRFASPDLARGVYVSPVPGSSSAAKSSATRTAVVTPRSVDVHVTAGTAYTTEGRLTVAVGYDNGQVRFWDATGTVKKSVTLEQWGGARAGARKEPPATPGESLPVYTFRAPTPVSGGGAPGTKVYSVAFGRTAYQDAAGNARPLTVLAATMSDRNLYVWPLPWLVDATRTGVPPTAPTASRTNDFKRGNPIRL